MYKKKSRLLKLLPFYFKIVLGIRDGHWGLRIFPLIVVVFIECKHKCTSMHHAAAQLSCLFIVILNQPKMAWLRQNWNAWIVCISLSPSICALRVSIACGGANIRCTVTKLTVGQFNLTLVTKSSVFWPDVIKIYSIFRVTVFDRNFAWEINLSD